jgi:2-polyprenyl-3-methyl-5-hydroxy-6-metoxy-1,4-benzoquinol methylase
MDIQQLYNKRFESQKILAKKNKIWRILCRHFFQKHIPEDSIVLDIAAGYCEFINNIKAKEKIAFDLNQDVKTFAGKEVRVINDSFFNMEKHLQEKKVDIIFASNILEHLDSKEHVVSAIKICAQNLTYNVNKSEQGGG